MAERGKTVVETFKMIAFWRGDPIDLVCKWADFLSFGDSNGTGSGFQPYLLDTTYRRDGIAIGPHEMGFQLYQFVFSDGDIPWWFAEITKDIQLPEKN